MDIDQLIQIISIGAIPVIFAITLHEAAHGYVAKRFGDPTAYMLGRVTLNPVKHIDPVGTIVMPLICLMWGGGLLFGWAKPVPVNFAQLRNPKRDMLWVAAAGPAANLFMIFFWAGIIKFASLIPNNPFLEPMIVMGSIGMKINAILMVLNLLPVPPLDGGRIAVSLLPAPWSNRLAGLETYGFIIFVALLIAQSQMGFLDILLGPFVRFALLSISSLFGI
ncbi:MAG TPA: site-2 protease family protein [Burkholderiales bacterium]|nr:site-2 protease family protein [Burkholderiales bacterium]